MAFNIVAQWSEGSTTNGNFTTTTAPNTTGADYIIVFRGCYNNRENDFASVQVTDTKSNSYVRKALASYGNSSFFGTMECYICENPTVGSSHDIISATGSGAYYPVIFAVALSGSNGVGAFDQASATGDITGTVQPGSITPTQTDEFVFTAASDAVGTTSGKTIDSSFTLLTNQFIFDGNHVGGVAGYKIKTGSSSAENPTFSNMNGGGGTDTAACICSIKSAGAGGGASKRPKGPNVVDTQFHSSYRERIKKPTLEEIMYYNKRKAA